MSASTESTSVPVGLLDALLEGLQVLDPDLRYVYVNRRAAIHGRTTPEALLGRTIGECYPGIEQTPLYAELERCLEQGTSRVMENEFRYPDGSVGFFELRIEAVPNGVCVLSVDNTARKLAEQELRHLQRVESIGRLAAGVAHEFNNLLSVMLATGEGALARPGGPTREDVGEILVAVRRAAAVTRQLLVMGRRQTTNHAVVDPVEVAVDLAAVLRPVVGPRIRLDVEGKLGSGHVRIDPTQFAQVITNLVLNARDAMPAGGRVLVHVASAGHLEPTIATTNAEFVVLSVQDEGIGIDAETQSRLFEPFFTTKEQGRGTGLGLSTVAAIVAENGGRVEVESLVGVGSTFRVYLPRAEPPSLPTRPTRRSLRRTS